MKVFSFGGGVQSHAVMVLHKRGVLYYDAFLFCNVGEDSENPETLWYVNEITRPYCEKHGIVFCELRKTKRDGSFVSLWEYTTGNLRTIPIPVYVGEGAPGNRQCTNEYKIDVIAKWTKAEGAAEEKPAVVGLGISTDEYQRMKNTRKHKWEVPEYPLIDLRMSREACHRLITDEGLPTPPKSSCWFCPFHSLETWRDMQARRPDLFEKSVALERRINEKRAEFGKDAVYLTRRMRPLDEVVSGYVALPETEVCESGYCMI